jgi:hypothetical protein
MVGEDRGRMWIRKLILLQETEEFETTREKVFGKVLKKANYELVKLFVDKTSAVPISQSTDQPPMKTMQRDMLHSEPSYATLSVATQPTFIIRFWKLVGE